MHKEGQINLVNAVMGAALLLFFLEFKQLGTLESYILWIATFTFIVHWWWGLVYFIENIGPTQNLPETFFDFITVAVFLSTILSVSYPPLWFTLNGLAFSLAFIKFTLVLKRLIPSEKVRTYMLEKRKIEVLGAISMFLAAFLSYKFSHYLLFSILILIGHLLTIGQMCYTKKIYELHD